MCDDQSDSLTLHDDGHGAERILAELAALREDVRHIRATLDERQRMPLPRVHLRIAMPLFEEIAAAVGDAK